MPEGKPAPLFRGVPVVVLFNANVPRSARSVVMLAIAGLIEELYITDGGPELLIAGVPPLAADYGWVARFTRASAESIAFTVTRQ